MPMIAIDCDMACTRIICRIFNCGRSGQPLVGAFRATRVRVAPNRVAQHPHETSVTCAGCTGTTSGKITILGVCVKGGCPACNVPAEDNRISGPGGAPSARTRHVPWLDSWCALGSRRIAMTLCAALHGRLAFRVYVQRYMAHRQHMGCGQRV